MSFPLNIKDYIKVYDNVFTKEFCTQTIDSLKSANWLTHQFYNRSGEYIHVGDDFLETRHEIPEQDIINQTLWKVIEQYVLVDFSKHYEKFGWFGGWQGYTSAKFHRYDTTTNMKLHCDHIHDIFDGTRKGIPIITIVGVLNDNYEGGDFLMWEKERISIPAGSVLVFPSNFMYPHEVTRITTGSRYSFVSWVF